MKICVLGDSIAKGVVYDEVKKRYVFLKNSCINMIQQNSGIEINNCSSFGCTVTKGENMLEKIEGELGEYDYTFVELGGNDCDYNWAKVAEDPYKKHDCNTPLEVFREKYAEIIEKIMHAGSKPVLVTLPPIDSARFFDWISKGLNKDNILKFLGDVDHISRWQSMFNDAVKQLSKYYNLPLYDIRSIFFDNKKKIADYLCKDGMHPNEEGHKLIYRAIANRTSLVPMTV